MSGLRIGAGPRSPEEVAGSLGAPDAPRADEEDLEYQVGVGVPIAVSDGRMAEAWVFVSGDFCVVEFPADGAESFPRRPADAKAFITDKLDLLTEPAADHDESALLIAWSPAEPEDELSLDVELLGLLSVTKIPVLVTTFLGPPGDVG